jgi:hypothetical protein
VGAVNKLSLISESVTKIQINNQWRGERKARSTARLARGGQRLSSEHKLIESFKGIECVGPAWWGAPSRHRTDVTMRRVSSSVEDGVPTLKQR